MRSLLDQRPYIVSGKVDGASGAQTGTGFRATKNTGLSGWYTVRFDRSFRGSPAIAISTESANSIFANTAPTDGRTFDVRVFTSNTGTLTDGGFAFVASGILA